MHPTPKLCVLPPKTGCFGPKNNSCTQNLFIFDPQIPSPSTQQGPGLHQDQARQKGKTEVRKPLLMALKLTPITIGEAKAFISRHHRRLRPRDSALFAIAVAKHNEIVGVATVSRPSASRLDGRHTAEVTRLCVTDNAPNACSMLYAACWRAAKAMGYTKIITYTSLDEPGTSLIAAGWDQGPTSGPRNWSTPSRPRNTPITHPKRIWTKGHDPGCLRPRVKTTPTSQMPLWPPAPTAQPNSQGDTP